MATCPVPNDYRVDAQRAFEVLQKGGIVIAKGDLGYGILTCDEDQLHRVFLGKGRAASKRHGILGNMDIHRSLHICNDPKKEEMIRVIVENTDVPLGIVMKFDRNNKHLARFSEHMLASASANGTMSVLVNGGKFIEELARLCWAAGLLLCGSSANISGKGIKYKLEDIEPEIRQLADLELDYGLAKYSIHGRASTMLDFERMKVVRFGAAYTSIQDVMKRFYGIDLPDDPGLEQLRDGHLYQLDDVPARSNGVLKPQTTSVI